MECIYLSIPFPQRFKLYYGQVYPAENDVFTYASMRWNIYITGHVK